METADGVSCSSPAISENEYPSKQCSTTTSRYFSGSSITARSTARSPGSAGKRSSSSASGAKRFAAAS